MVYTYDGINAFFYFSTTQKLCVTCKNTQKKKNMMREMKKKRKNEPK